MAEKDDNSTEPAGLTSGKTPDLAPPDAGAGEPETAAQGGESAEAAEVPKPEPEQAEPPKQEQPEPQQVGDFPKAPPISGFPKAGVDPVAVDTTADRPKPPGSIQAAFILTIGASVVLLLGQVVFILFKQQLVDQAVKAVPAGRKVDVAQVESNANTLVWALFVGALCYGAIMVLFAYKAREGTRSARTVVTLLAVLGLVFQLGIVRSIFSVVSSLLLVIVVILLYLPSTRDFFPKVGKKL
ncbi:hypothetical protein [Amycolatopsis sp. NPDC051903]|uniref:hypothetical protein n=1 Tax=Amycolatopsis sp. NPDC051903 TaxID=3363936 RepID=UPI00379A963D